MLTNREQKMNVGLLKDNSFVKECEYISKKSVIDFKESGNEILRKDNTKEMKIKDNRRIQNGVESENQNKDNSESQDNDFESSKKIDDAFRGILRR